MNQYKYFQNATQCEKRMHKQDVAIHFSNGQISSISSLTLSSRMGERLWAFIQKSRSDKPYKHFDAFVVCFLRLENQVSSCLQKYVWWQLNVLFLCFKVDCLTLNILYKNKTKTIFTWIVTLDLNPDGKRCQLRFLTDFLSIYYFKMRFSFELTKIKLTK